MGPHLPHYLVQIHVCGQSEGFGTMWPAQLPLTAVIPNQGVLVVPQGVLLPQCQGGTWKDFGVSSSIN